MLCSFPHFLLRIGNSYFMLIRQFTGLLLKGDYDGVEWSKALGWEMAKGKSWLKRLKVILHRLYVKQSWGLFLDPNMHVNRKELAEKLKLTATLKN